MCVNNKFSRDAGRATEGGRNLEKHLIQSSLSQYDLVEVPTEQEQTCVNSVAK